MKFRAFTQPYMDGIGLMVVDTDDYGKVSYYAKPVLFEMVERTPNTIGPVSPTMDLAMQDAVGLMNALWEAGVRPTEFKHPSGEINRMQAHIADLRAMAFRRDNDAE